jgi:glyceraldehyde-3-phosphate dehydrogenase/erythrose-4-phosphate dehydrogenase
MHSDLRRARAAVINNIPISTDAAKALPIVVKAFTIVVKPLPIVIKPLPIVIKPLPIVVKRLPIVVKALPPRSFDGISLRVPEITGLLIDLSVNLEEVVNVAQPNDGFFCDLRDQNFKGSKQPQFLNTFLRLFLPF